MLGSQCFYKLQFYYIDILKLNVWKKLCLGSKEIRSIKNQDNTLSNSKHVHSEVSPTDFNGMSSALSICRVSFIRYAKQSFENENTPLVKRTSKRLFRWKLKHHNLVKKEKEYNVSMLHIIICKLFFSNWSLLCYTNLV